MREEHACSRARRPALLEMLIREPCLLLEARGCRSRTSVETTMIKILEELFQVLTRYSSIQSRKIPGEKERERCQLGDRPRDSILLAIYFLTEPSI